MPVKDNVTWTWVQPKNQDELLARLADARDLNVPERERENLCACACAEIKRLSRIITGTKAFCADRWDVGDASDGTVRADEFMQVYEEIEQLEAGRG